MSRRGKVVGVGFMFWLGGVIEGDGDGDGNPNLEFLSERDGDEEGSGVVKMEIQN